MGNYTDGKLDVEQYETRADTTVGIAASGTLEDVQQAAAESVVDVLQLCYEVRRLQGIEDRLKSLMAHKKEQIAKDRKTAAEQGNSWLGVNTHTIAANLLDGELQNLEKVLGNGS